MAMSRPSRSEIIRIERKERDLIDRLCYKIAYGPASGRKPVSKASLLSLEEPQVAPAALSSACLGVLGAGALGTISIPTSWSEKEPFSRRAFLCRGPIIGGAAAAALLWHAEQQLAQAAGIWGKVLGAVFAPLVGWFVNKVMDYAWYKLTAADVKYVESPKPTPTQFHNDFAAPYHVVTPRYQFKPRKLPNYDAEFGMSTFLLKYDVNYPEASQIKLEHEAKKTSPLVVPTTRRYEVKERNQKAVRETAAHYGLKPGEYKAEYVNVLTDNKTVEHPGIGVTRGKKAHFLIHDE